MFERKAELLNISPLLWIMVFGWRRRPRAGRTWLLHRLLSSNQWARLNLQASKSTGLLVSVGMFECIKGGEGILPQSDENPHILSLQAYRFFISVLPCSGLAAVPALISTLWGCQLSTQIYVLVINSGPQLFQLSFSMSMPIILNLVSYLYLVHFYLVYSFASLSRLF